MISILSLFRLPHQTLTYAIISLASHSHTTTIKKKLTRIDLHDLRDRQTHFIPIQRRRPHLQRIALEIHRLQLLLILQLALHLVEARQLVIRPPQLLQMHQLAQALELRHLVVREVDHAERRVAFEAGQVGDGVVREVDFFEAREVREPADVREAVGLDGEDAEVLERVEVLVPWLDFTFGWLVGWEDGGTLSSVILFFPSQSSSSEVRESRFSISCINHNRITNISLESKSKARRDRNTP